MTNRSQAPRHDFPPTPHAETPELLFVDYYHAAERRLGGAQQRRKKLFGVSLRVGKDSTKMPAAQQLVR